MGLFLRLEAEMKLLSEGGGESVRKPLVGQVLYLVLDYLHISTISGSQGTGADFMIGRKAIVEAA